MCAVSMVCNLEIASHNIRGTMTGVLANWIGLFELFASGKATRWILLGVQCPSHPAHYWPVLRLLTIRVPAMAHAERPL